MEKEFICPLCHTKHPIDGCEIEERFISSKHTGTRLQGRFFVQSFVDTYRYVRLCGKCAKKIKITRTILKIIFYGGLPTFLTLRMLFEGVKYASDYFLIPIMFLLFLFFTWIINGIINKILEHTVFDIDFEQAYKDNALLTYYEIEEYKKKKKNK